MKIKQITLEWENCSTHFKVKETIEWTNIEIDMNFWWVSVEMFVSRETLAEIVSQLEYLDNILD